MHGFQAPGLELKSNWSNGEVQVIDKFSIYVAPLPFQQFNAMTLIILWSLIDRLHLDHRDVSAIQIFR